MNHIKINKIFEIFCEDNPSPETELNYTNHYTLLVAVVLSAQTTDIIVNRATEDLFKIADSASKMLLLGEEKLKSHIKIIGLYNSKAKNIIALSKMVMEEYHGEIPGDLDSLQTLPGVGRKTAKVFLNCGLGMPVIAVDTHVFRVSNRIGIVKAKTVLKTEEHLEKKIPAKWKFNAHHWLILHGRYICKARSPTCTKCKIYDLCEYKFKTVKTIQIQSDPA